ncbi:MAG: M20/M25/M40 family metallo-hydrolase [Dehalococcoidales bacterium]|nr:M20/M25/M40 family metallo-hydrolase [Dehalococcoidales bacterium]
MDYLKVAKDILAIDTSIPPGLNYEKVMDYLEPLFKEVGFETEQITIPREHSDGNDPRINLIAHRRSPGQPRLIFYGHIDVVPAQGWPAFTPRIEDGKIYGRGAADMKGGVVALLLGLDMARELTPRYDMSVMITTDEEVGQAEQLRYLGRYLQPLSGAHLFNLDSSFGYISIASLGALQMDIIVKGKSVHSGLSHLGENAVEKAALLLAALLRLKKQVVKRRSKVAVHPETGLRRMQARLNINMIQGGLKANIIPDECVITVDRRLIPEEDIEVARKEILDTLRAVPDVQWELGKVFAIPTVPPSGGPIVDEVAGLVKQVTGQSGKYGEMGSGDLPHIGREWGAIEFGLGVIRADCNIHGKDEFAYQQDIESLATIIARFIAA